MKTLEKRVKVTTACSYCRKRKLKCDGAEPCLRCQSSKVECLYICSSKKRGPSKYCNEVIGTRARRIEFLLKPKSYLSESKFQEVPVNVLYCIIAERVDYKKTNGSLNVSSLHISNKEWMSETWSLYFFNYFNSLFPLISQRSQETSSLLDLAISALGALYSSFRCHFFLFKQAEIQLELAEVGIEKAQALVILFWYSHLVGDAKKCGVFRRQVAGYLSWLKLKADDTDSECRIYWVAWVLDQWIASCTLSEGVIPYYDYPWPSSEHFRALIELSMLLKEPNEARLTKWLLSLPSSLDYTQTSCVIAKLFRLFYYTTQMIFNQRQPHPASHSICATAANIIIYLTQQIIEKEGPCFLYNLFFLSLTFATSFVYLDSHLDSTRLLKQVNCTLLSEDEFDPLLEAYFGLP